MKSKKTRRLISSIIAGLLVFALIFSFFSGILLNARAASQTSVDALRKKISGITGDKKSIQKELSALTTEKKTVLSKKSALEKESALLKQEIEATDQLIAELAELIQVKTGELAAAEEDEAQQYALFKERVRVMYEKGNLTYLETLLDAGSFSEMLSRAEIIAQIMEHDTHVAEELKEKREAVAEAKASLESDRAEEEALKESLTKSRDELERKIKESEKMAQELEKDEETIRREYAAMEAEEKKLQAELKKQVAALAKKSSYVGGTMTWPLPSSYQTITSSYGMRLHPTLKVYKLHTGIDISAPKNTSIYAANDGEVITSAYTNAWGNYVVINHGGGTATLYAHMTTRLVSVGAKVSKGDVIGKVGSTGYSTGNHLHFEIQKNGTSINPMTEFKKVG